MLRDKLGEGWDVEVLARGGAKISGALGQVGSKVRAGKGKDGEDEKYDGVLIHVGIGELLDWWRRGELIEVDEKEAKLLDIEEGLMLVVGRALEVVREGGGVILSEPLPRTLAVSEDEDLRYAVIEENLDVMTLNSRLGRRVLKEWGVEQGKVRVLAHSSFWNEGKQLREELVWEDGLHLGQGGKALLAVECARAVAEVLWQGVGVVAKEEVREGWG